MPKLSFVSSWLLAASFLRASATILPLRPRQDDRLASRVPFRMTGYGTLFGVDVEIGNQTFNLLFDTGSSDTWERCNYGPAYHESPSFRAVDNETLAIGLGLGHMVGNLGHDDVTVGGVTVSGQKIGVVDMTSDIADGVRSGILGFGHPILTSAHPAGFDHTNRSLLEEKLPYNPWLQSAAEQGKLEPFFSVAIERSPLNDSDGAGGYLGLGAVVDVPTTSEFVTVPAEVNKAIPLELTNGEPTITLWTLTVQGTTTDGNTNSTSFQAVPDTGNAFDVYPAAVAAAINAAFDPPGMLVASDLDQYFLYDVECDAKPPLHSVFIGNASFPHEPADLTFRNGTEGGCVSSIAGWNAQGGPEAYFLVSAFFKNVVAVYDFGRKEMWFASRTAPTIPGGNNAASEGGRVRPGAVSVSVSMLLSVVSLLSLPSIF
ncbi:aspartic-type endopeptidase [Colletotrichum sojae]|uniref:Aspartic-type endopeptidase n=1 Tax=Colletotrichum sojae TaxID=2175907 RepID=A0A8H6J7C4_9PEZI|nr:aspartic-type endopeptidase [Colletotrichum sojae]